MRRSCFFILISVSSSDTISLLLCNSRISCKISNNSVFDLLFKPLNFGHCDCDSGKEISIELISAKEKEWFFNIFNDKCIPLYTYLYFAVFLDNII